jgi:hypothetical protein
MNNILYNISLLILFIGSIMMTIYITKSLYVNCMISEQNPTEDIYDYKVSKAYNKMFSQPSIWLGYQEFDSEYQTEKLYIKNKNI